MPAKTHLLPGYIPGSGSSCGKLLLTGLPVRILLGHLDCPPTPLVSQEWPAPPAASDRKQTELPRTEFVGAPQPFQQLLGVGTAVPLGLGHGLRLVEQEVYQPAAADMDCSLLTEVLKNLLVVAASLL